MTHPFGTPWLFVVDVGRIVLSVLDLFLIVWILAIAVGFRNTRQFGCYSLAAFAAASAFTEITVIGTEPNIRIILNTIGTLSGLVYVIKVRAFEPPWHRGKHRPPRS